MKICEQFFRACALAHFKFDICAWVQYLLKIFWTVEFPRLSAFTSLPLNKLSSATLSASCERSDFSVTFSLQHSLPSVNILALPARTPRGVQFYLQFLSAQRFLRVKKRLSVRLGLGQAKMSQPGKVRKRTIKVWTKSKCSNKREPGITNGRRWVRAARCMCARG